MAVRRNISTGYGFGQPLVNTSPAPIVSQRAPKATDKAEIGTIWVDQPNDAAYVLVKIASNSASWKALSGGAGEFTTITTTSYADINGALDVAGDAAFASDVGVADSVIFDAGPEVLAGAGSPNTVVTAPKGSLFLRTDGTTTNDRAYINTDGSTGWSALTTAA